MPIEKMKILGRDVTARYSQEKNLLWVDLSLKEGDCPEGKNNFAAHLCSGGCQQTYMTVVYKNNNEILTAGGITKGKTTIIVDSEFCKKNNLSRLKGEGLVGFVLAQKQAELEKVIPEAKRGVEQFYKLFEDAIGKESWAGWSDKKFNSLVNIKFEKTDRYVKVLVNNEQVACLYHLCNFLNMPYDFSEIFNNELTEISSKINELKSIAKKLTLDDLAQMYES